MSTVKINKYLSLNLPIKIWVLAPSLQTNDDNIDYYYDFTQSIAEYTKSFAELELQWQWQPVTINNFEEIIDEIIDEKKEGCTYPVVFNICDGDEINGAPGVSVVKYLEKNKMVYTGAEAFFYNITTSKIAMKKAFDKANVLNANWCAIVKQNQNLTGIFNKLGTPIIVKPSISGGSMGVSTKNVVSEEKALKEIVEKMFNGYRGWNLCGDGLVAESFINGAEFTCFIIGSYNMPESAIIYNPVERVFHSSLPENEKFLSFDRLWEIYEDETAMPNNENFYEYKIVDASIIEKIKQLSWDAFVSVKGTGYARIDIRQDKNTGQLYILEVNAQCGLSEDEDFTSIGAILKVSNKTFTHLVAEVINEALQRKQSNLPLVKKSTKKLVKETNG